MIDWTFALLFRADITKVDLAGERTLFSHNGAAGARFAEKLAGSRGDGSGERM